MLPFEFLGQGYLLFTILELLFGVIYFSFQLIAKQLRALIVIETEPGKNNIRALHLVVYMYAQYILVISTDEACQISELI